MGTVRVSNCGHDERGKYSGGVAGDQSGTEWYLRDWYNYPWNYVLRWKDATLGNLFADLAVEAAQNNFVGYDQNQRDTFWAHLKASNYRPAQITVKCEADCSSGVVALIKAVGYLKGIGDLQNCYATYTGDMMPWFRSAAGAKYFEVLTGRHLTDPSVARRGDINLNTAHHVNVTVDNGANAGAPAATPKPAEPKPAEPQAGGDTVYTVRAGDTLSGIAAMYGTTYQVLAEYNGISDPNVINVGQQIRIPGGKAAPKKTIKDIAKEVIAGKWGNGEERRKRLEAAGYDYSKVQDKVNKLLQ